MWETPWSFDEDTIIAADYAIDIGPEAEVNGGNNCCRKEQSNQMHGTSKSITEQYLSGRENNLNFSKQTIQYIKVINAWENNLKNIDDKCKEKKNNLKI